MSIYAQSQIGDPDNQIVFNNYTSNPVYRVQSRAPQSFQIRNDDIPTPYEDGVTDYQTLIGQTLYVLNGTMYPFDEVSFDRGLAALRSVGSLTTEQNDSFSTDSGYVPYIWGDASGQKQLFVKVLYTKLTEDTRQGFVQPFQMICKIKDPTIYSYPLKIASTQQSNPTSTGGAAVYSFAYPIVYGSTQYNVSADANNNGTIPGYPSVITVFGPINNPKITNTKTGEFISVGVSLNSNTDMLVIQYNKDDLTVTLNGANVIRYVSQDSVYFKIKPGTNTIQLSGGSVGSGSYATVAYYDTLALA